MPTPFKTVTSGSQHLPGEQTQIIFPSEQPRLHASGSMNPISAPNLSDEAFRATLSPPGDPLDTSIRLQGLHNQGLASISTKHSTDADGALGFSPYGGSLENHLGYGVSDLEFNGVIQPTYTSDTANSEEMHVHNNALGFYQNTNANDPPKSDPQTNPLFSDQQIPTNQILTSSASSIQPHIKDEEMQTELTQPTAMSNVPAISGKIAAGTASTQNQKAAPPPINTDTPSSHASGGTKSQHNTWRRGNKGRTPLSVKRSQSTPNVQLAAQLAAASAVSAPPMPSASTTDDLSPVALAYQLDKKRNKLGYHRTSVACGHCRRRKIRCILAKDESGRCSNCIRLKKECSFYPVESTDRRPRSASKPEISSQLFQDNCSSPSSPTRSPRFSVDQINIAPTYDGSLYPSSLPITPNYDCETPTSTFDDSYRNRSLSSGSRVSLAFSNAGSRRPSLAHMFTAPLPSREFRSLSDASPTYAETFSSFSSRYGNATKAVGIGIEDPTSSFWRLENASTNFSPLSQQINFGGMPSLQEDTVKHERLNSVDNGVGPMTQTYSDLGLFTIGSDPPLDDTFLNNGKVMADIQNGQSFVGEGTEQYSGDASYGFSWNDPQKSSSGVPHTSSLAENWFLPQQSASESLCDQDPPIHRLNQTAVGVKHQL
ncbi:hypothetical protein ABW19_dt0202164 [Dactylella cylindrospora]|nr:hypothetical protein ABW19_dt0202164 [Dactylella cylindrospora]